MDPGSKVTYNGVPIGRVATVDKLSVGGVIKSRLTLAVEPKYVHLIPTNVDAVVDASTVFGKKYLALSSPKKPSPQRITSSDVIDVASVTTEFNTLFETIVDVSAHVDPVKLNQLLSATAYALDGLGDGFGQSIIQGNELLAEINPQMAQIRRDNELVAELAETYANAAPDLFDGLQNAETTALTLNGRRANIDQALMAAIGFGKIGSDVFERSAPYLVRGSQDLISTSELLDEYSPSLFCMIRNYHDVEPKASQALGGNGRNASSQDAREK